MRLTSQILFTPILLGLACSGCAKEDSAITENATTATKSAPVAKASQTIQQNSTEVYLDAEGNVLVLRSKENNQLQGSLISMTDGDSELRYRRIMKILNTVPVDKNFVAKVGERLKVNRRLKQETFVLPLVDEKGDTHNFEYISNTDQQLYTLNYLFEQAAE